VVQVERARILLEKALAKQKRTPFVFADNVPPIVVDPMESPGLEKYLGDLHYRAMNNALKAESSSDWEKAYKRWNANHYAPKSEQEFGDSIIRGAIQTERDLKLNPSPFSPDIAGQKKYQQDSLGARSEDDYGYSIRSNDIKRQGDFYELEVPRTLRDEVESPSILTNPLSYDWDILSRGIGFDKAGQQQYLDELAKGKEHKTFLSFTTDGLTTQDFLKRNSRKGGHGVFLKVVDPKDGKAMEHPYWAFNPEESEFLYLPGTRLELFDVKTGKAAQQVKDEAAQGMIQRKWEQLKGNSSPERVAEMEKGGLRQDLYDRAMERVKIDPNELVVEVVPRPSNLVYPKQRESLLQETLALLEERRRIQSELSAKKIFPVW
jgi:hypothetical protein